MPGRRIGPLFAVIVAAVVLFASHSWLKGIFGYGEIATDIPFLLAGAILFLAWRVNRRAANRRSSLLGSARFGGRADVRQLEGNGGLLIGRSIEGGKLLRYDGPAHLLTMAPTRSGKGVGTIIPNLLTLDRSVVCIDPKGENARVTARARASKGDGGVWTLSASPGVLRPATTRWHGSIRQARTSRKMRRRSPTRWSTMRRGNRVRRTGTSQGADRRRDPAHRRPQAPCPRDARRYAGQHRRGRPDRPRRQPPARQVEPGSRRRALVGAAAHPLHGQPAPGGQHLGVRFPVRGPQGTAGHGVSVPAARPARHLCAWLRLLVGQAVTDMARSPARPANPVLFLLDEFAALGRLEPVGRAMGLMAGYGFQLWPILQDMHQLRALYGERAGTFLSNAGVVQTFGVNDHATADMLSRTIGDTTIEYETVSTSHKTSWFDSPDASASVSGHVAARRLVTPDEIMRMPADTLLLLRQGERPLWAKKIRYYDQREFGRLFDPA